jgi:hypothetical protein
MNCAHFTRLYRKNTVKFAQQAILVVFVMLTQALLKLKKELKLRFCQGFDQKALIMAEKEETPTPASSFTSLENLLSVILWIKGVIKLILVFKNFRKGLLKGQKPMESDLHFIL